MPLYRVKIEDVIIVAANSAEQASLALPQHLQAEYRINGFRGLALVERARFDDTPANWLDCYPHGGSGERTVRELLDPSPDGNSC